MALQAGERWRMAIGAGGLKALLSTTTHFDTLIAEETPVACGRCRLGSREYNWSDMLLRMGLGFVRRLLDLDYQALWQEPSARIDSRCRQEACSSQQNHQTPLELGHQITLPPLKP